MADERMIADLPAELQRYFWDYRPQALSGEERHTVIARLLQVGGWDAVRWLRASVGDEGLRAFLTRRRGRGIGPKRLRFWGVVLDVPREQVDAWIESSRANPWHDRVAP